MLNNIDRLDQAVLAEDWESAQTQLQEIERDWIKILKVYEVILEHYDLDEINKTLVKIEKYIEVEEKNLTLGEISQLKFVVETIKEREVFSISNLF